MDTYINIYESWLTYDKETKEELLQIEDEKEIEDRFYKDLTFGTGGLRGIMGAGANRLNQYTVKKASFGLAMLLLSKKKKPRIAIAYDTRNNSQTFAENAADVFTALGIKTYIFEECMPTPVLSYTIRHLGCDAGVVITASHNPKEYNGYKVYNSRGGQLVPFEAADVMKCIKSFPGFDFVRNLERNEKKLEWIDNQILDSFIKEIPKKSMTNCKLKIVFSPLHGTGNKPIQKVLRPFNVSVVKEQELYDGDFSTVSSPNPENREALQMAISKAEEEDADIVLATDPDCDRLGVAVKHNNEFITLTGNQIGALLVDYLTSKNSPNKENTIIKTIVTNELGANIAKKRGFQVLDTLTGFKYIGEKINLFEEHNQENKFLFGYEESYGYLFGKHARDKDAISSAWLVCEMAETLLAKKLTLIDQLNEIYSEFGFFLDELDSITILGKDGVKKIDKLMEKSRDLGRNLAENIVQVKDYSNGIEGLPPENVLKFILSDDSWFAIRPSGTEPKIKFYYSVQAKDFLTASKRLKQMKRKIEKELNIQLPK